MCVVLFCFLMKKDAKIKGNYGNIKTNIFKLRSCKNIFTIYICLYDLQRFLRP